MNSKKLYLLVLVLVLALIATACGSQPAEEPAVEEPVAEEPVAEEPAEEEPMDEGPCAPATDGPLAGVDPRGQTVVWWHQHDEDDRLAFMDKWVVDFNNTNECGITVEQQLQGGYNDIRDKMNAGIATGELPGLVVGYQNDQAFYALAGGLADMNLYIDDPTWGLGDDKGDYFSAFLEQGVHAAYDGARLGFPPNRSMLMMFYNITWLKELGFDGSPPETPDELREMACAAAEANGDGTGGLFVDAGASAIAGWTFAFGGNVLSDDGTGYVYNGQGTVDAMTFLKGMMDDGCAYILTEGYPNPAFAARQFSFTTGSSSGIPYYVGDVATVAEEEGREPDEFNVAPLPHTTADPVQNVYGGDVMIPSTTPETQLAAWIFIKYYTSPQIQSEWVRASNYFPTRAGTTEFLGDYMEENPVWATAVDLLPYGTYEPQLISYQSVRDAASQAANEIFQGADIQETLDNLTTEANELQAELTE
jgi:multiple sugar transport system substrate-binding protein/sn-glycerol 3-phosphate transport system substrate-binding protein